MAEKIKITLVKSIIDRSKNQKENVKRLGLGKINSSVVHTPTPQIMGMVHKVAHLVTTKTIED